MNHQKNKYTRRTALKMVAATSAMAVGSNFFSQASPTKNIRKENLKGRIKHSVCRWTYGSLSLEELCAAAKSFGISAIDLVGPEEWPTLKKYGLHASLTQGAGKGISDGFNDPKLHDELVASYEEVIPLVAAAGYSQIICFSGNRRGLDDETGIKNCAIGLKRLMPIAEKHKVTMVMELLNSKVDHHDYQCDHTAWGAALCEEVDSENFKLLYDIYHMQIMEGDVISTIRKYHPYISHYHTAGVPGRNEIDDNQELNYPAIIKAIVETGFKGYLAQEFIPKQADKLASLQNAIQICDV